MKNLIITSLSRCLFLAVALGLAVHAKANLVVNGSFENPTPNPSWYFGNPDGPFIIGSVPGWTTGYGHTGVWQPNIAGGQTFGSLPGGTQAGWASEGGELSMMYQDLALTITAGQTYDLSLFIGNRKNLGTTYGMLGGGWAELVSSGGTVLASSGNVFATPGTFQGVNLSYTAAAGSSMLGQTLRIELGNSERSQASFDNVVVRTVPEPFTMALMGCSAIAGFARARRKKK
jgi:hypothetical protein